MPHRTIFSAILLLNTLLLVPPTLAADLPVDGVWGDELGCQRHSSASGLGEAGGITLQSHQLRGYEWGCRFAEVWPFSTTLYGVQSLCGGEGVPFLEQYIFQLPDNDSDTLLVMKSDGTPIWQLKACTQQ